MSDKYDDEIERLVKSSGGQVYESWVMALPLFQFCGGGCLTMVRSRAARAYTPELTRQIRADKKIPTKIDALEYAWDEATESQRRKLLQPFARWQRRLDREIREAPCP